MGILGDINVTEPLTSSVVYSRLSLGAKAAAATSTAAARAAVGVAATLKTILEERSLFARLSISPLKAHQQVD